MRTRRVAVAAFLSVVAFAVVTTSAGAFSGQVFFAGVSVEPAVNDANGATIYLLTPNGAPFPSKANSVATAPLYLPMYPLSSSIHAADLNCQPTNCDHVQAVPPPIVAAESPVYPAGGAYLGHDHIVGVAKSGGDFNVAWHVILLAFTPHAVLDGAVNTRLLTDEQIGAAELAGDVQEFPTPIVFNCSIVNEKVYTQHM